jgi:hypothetical protein
LGIGQYTNYYLCKFTKTLGKNSRSIFLVFHQEPIDIKVSVNLLIVPLLLFPLLAYPYTDESHYSKTFGEARFFRVFTPSLYNPTNAAERYPVIYYFHGCGGSYQRSGTYSYVDYGLVAPKTENNNNDPAYGFPNNADFENFVHNNEVIIVSVDGRIAGIPGCGVYFPSQVESWEGNYYNFSSYIRELISVVDLRYHTKAGPQYRAVSGLSMGGQMAIWIAATNPHLFSSASEFCHSPNFYDVGEPSYLTTIDVKQLWRNFRGLPFRHTTTDRDYLRYYTAQLFEIYQGAGFKNEYYLADFCKHYAARIDLQFDFHLDSFNQVKNTAACFSHINLYPEFEVWGYNVLSSKKGNGWIYLHDVSKNGLGIYTRKRLPYATSLSEFDIKVVTPAYYIPNADYTLSRYSYHNNSFNSQQINADSLGKLTITSTGGMGEEIGIIGEGLQPPVFVLTDTINENIYLTAQFDTPLSFDVVNLSTLPHTVDFIVSTENNDLLTILSQPKSVVLPAKSKTHIDSLVVVYGSNLDDYKNTGYIKIGTSIDGTDQEREHIIPVVVKRVNSEQEAASIIIFDGRSEELALFKYNWNGWDHPYSSGTISEGVGNGNGRAEMNETFSLWIRPQSSLAALVDSTWQPTTPINWKVNPDVSVKDILQYQHSTGRAILSAQISLDRNPTKEKPIRISLQTESLKVQYLENDCHRNTADDFRYSYYDLVIYEDGSIGMEKKP